MSELKAFYLPRYAGAFTMLEVYLKSEADKVIAELEGKLDLYKRGFKEDDKTIAYLYAELRHQKYKRCLAMARWCNRMFSSTFGKERYWQKWNRRWLKLAEKLKNEEAK